MGKWPTCCGISCSLLNGNVRLLEHQAKQLLSGFGIPVPRGLVCRDAEAAAAAWDQIGASAGGLVLKAQVPIGKRGKGGGVSVVRSRAHAEDAASALLQMTVGGFAVTEILAEELVPISAELYLSVLTDTSPAHPRPLLMISARGGMDIEELAAAAPDSLYRLHADPAYGLHPYQARELARRSGLSVEGQGALTKIIGATYRAYWESDAELVEINPLALTTAGDLVAVDAKVTIDNAARGRHPDIKGAEIDSVETRAAAMGLSYVELEGDIGLISNGAGLTMATMDHLALLGGRPANFLDTGERILRGGIADGMGLLLSNPRVNAVLINVFGGGVRCDVIAQKIVEAVGALPAGHLPVVATLHGRNEKPVAPSCPKRGSMVCGRRPPSKRRWRRWSSLRHRGAEAAGATSFRQQNGERGREHPGRS